MPLTLGECNLGDELILIKDFGHAQKGARCFVSGSDHSYVYVKWHRDHLSAGQHDGGYYADMFEKAFPEPFVIETPKSKSEPVDYMKAVREICGSY